MVKKLLGLLVCILTANQSYAISIEGKPYVIDGDTIKMEVKIRLKGIDAPELNQQCVTNNEEFKCGELSKHKMIELVSKRKIICEIDDTDQYGRFLGTCEIKDTDININRWMVKNGWALSYFTDEYKDEESYAKENRLGIWEGEFTRPSLYRKQQNQKKKPN